MAELALDEAVELTRTGDVWVFRGASIADRAIRALTNAPVNHVGMAVVLEDMPPLLWHAELGRSLPDAWTGQHQRGVQLHDLRDAVVTWRRRYGQRAWLRQLVGPAEDGGVTPEMEDAVLRTIARLDGRPFPTTRGLVRGWVNGRLRRQTSAETVFCAELVAATYTAMGLLPGDRPLNAYDPGSFWSGDDLELLQGARLGPEIPVEVSLPVGLSLLRDRAFRRVPRVDSGTGRSAQEGRHGRGHHQPRTVAGPGCTAPALGPTGSRGRHPRDRVEFRRRGATRDPGAPRGPPLHPRRARPDERALVEERGLLGSPIAIPLVVDAELPAFPGFEIVRARPHAAAA